MKLGLAVLFIGAVIVPACAQKVIKPIKPIKPKVPQKTPIKNSTIGKRSANSVITPGVVQHSLRIPGSTAKNVVVSSSSAIPKLSKQAQGSVLVSVAPKTSVSLSDAQIQAGLERAAALIRFEELTFPTTVNAVYRWLVDNPGKYLSDNPVLKEKMRQLSGNNQKGNFLIDAPMRPLAKKLLTRSAKSFTQLLQENETYPHEVSLDRFGFPAKLSSSAIELDIYLLAADPVEMGAFIANPTLVEAEALGRSGLLLSENERVSVEQLLERRLERLMKLRAEDYSTRDVLQVAYDYFATQQHLTYGTLRDMDFEYRYRTDLPFEQLTTAEKEGFIVHKLIRHKLKNNNKSIETSSNKENLMKNIDMAHLQLIDYVTLYDYSRLEKFPAALQAYQTLKATFRSCYIKRDFLDYDVILKRAEEAFAWDFNSFTRRASLEEIQKVFALLPEKVKDAHRELERTF